MTPEQWTQILTISPAAACVILVVVLFLRHLRGANASSAAHFKDQSDAFMSLVARIDASQAARDERISSAIEANTRATAEIHGLLMGRATHAQHINGSPSGGGISGKRAQPLSSAGPTEPES